MVDDEEAAQRLVREITLLRRIDHPHVVRLHRVLDLPDGGRALVLDLAAGGSLADLITARGSLRAGEVSTIVVGLARALSDLHARGLIHGDITPRNVLFAQDGRPLLADLGLAAVLGADDAPAPWGTPGFADPTGGPASDPSRDVRALGAIAWFALTGLVPATEPDARAQALATDVPDRARSALLRLALSCLDRDPLRRPAAVDIAGAAWRAAAPGPVRLVDDSDRADGSEDRADSEGIGCARDVNVTRRVRAPAPPGDDEEVVRRRGRRRVRRWRRGRGGTGPWWRSHRAGPVSRVGWRRWSWPVAAPVLLAASVGTVLGVRGEGHVGAGGSSSAEGSPVAALATAPGRSGSVASSGSPGGIGARRAAPPPVFVGADGRRIDEAALERAVAALARSRAAAFADASVWRLQAVDAPGSPALATDIAFVHRLTSSGVRLRGLRFDVSALEIESGDADGVTVLVRVTTSAHSRTRPDGTVTVRVPQSQVTMVRLVLVPVPGAPGWRVRSVGT